ncbi:MAG: M48 family metalloprotease, partial [Pseudomonadales bacterium]
MSVGNKLAICALSGSLLFTAGCAVNPVTGENELSLVSAQQEVTLGSQQYLPTQQSQGGQYYLDPELTYYVNTVGKELAAKSGRPDLPYEFVVLNNSTPNAWALPGGKIAVNRGLLLELEDEAELAAVLGHEITHAAARHSAQQMSQQMLMGVGLAALQVATDDTQYGNLILGSAGLGAQMIQGKYGRDAERESDYYGMRAMAAVGYDPQGAVELQETFVKLSKGRDQDWVSGLFSTHPPSQERVDANKKTAQALPSGGARNESVYNRRIAKIRHDKPAYDAYDKGMAALAKKDSKQALKLAERAISLQKQESQFHELRGAALEAQGLQQNALKAYDKAIALNSQYYSHYLSRGLLRKELGDSAGAKKDLEASNRLLPTSAAQ